MIIDSEDGELVRASPGGWWIDGDKVHGALCHQLLRLLLIRLQPGSHLGDELERFELGWDPDEVDL